MDVLEPLHQNASIVDTVPPSNNGVEQCAKLSVGTSQKQWLSTESRSKSLGNLRPFRKGVSGNPGGRARGRTVTAELRRLVERGATSQKLAEVILQRALAGDLNYVRLLLDRVDGVLTKNFDLKFQKSEDLDSLSDGELEAIVRSGQPLELGEGLVDSSDDA